MSDDPWMQHMRRGEFEAAWRISVASLGERRGVVCQEWPRHLQYIWDGEPLDGKRVLVRCYHGLGDTIQFIRYMPLLRRIAAHVIVWAQPMLLPLLATVDGIDELIPLHDGVPGVAYDVDVELMELPFIFRTTLASVPANVPYLRAAGEVREGQVVPDEPSSLESKSVLQTVSNGSSRTTCPTKVGLPMKVGVVWRAGTWDDRRSMPAALMAGLSENPDVQLHVLQSRSSIDDWPPEAGKLICPEPVTELAREIAALDLLVTIDSLPAHLGGALGVPTWTLIPTNADWRWMSDRSDSPWYPTMRLWRQDVSGDWSGVMSRVKYELRALVDRTKKSAD